MAKYDHGGGCSCGLYRECQLGCREYKESLTSDFSEYHRMLKMEKDKDPEREAYWDRVAKEFPEMYKEEKPYVEEATRPWGSWYVLDLDQGYKVKRLEILPDQSISLQYHNHRSEHWTIVQGEGRLIIHGTINEVSKGDSFTIPKQTLHKITNTHLTETLIAIEVQIGDICSEDDIVRC